MSQDLFAAFGDHPQDQSAAGLGSIGDDDWGDFEDAATATATATATDTAAETAVETSNKQVQSASKDHQKPQNASSSFPPKAPKREEAPSLPSSSKVGKHPFADHMDLLFAHGEDEYDAGADDLENLATNPEAAMAYSKRVIAEQEARAAREVPPPSIQKNQMLIWQAEKPVLSTDPLSNADVKKSNARRFTKSQPQPQAKPQTSTNPPQARNKLRKKSGYAPAKDPNVLFDAENVSDSDDFGEFEGDTPEPANTITANSALATKHTVPLPNVDMLSLEDTLKPLGEVGRSRTASARDTNTALGPPKHTSANSQANNVIPKDDDPWAEFETDVVQTTHTTTSNAYTQTAATSTDAIQDDAGWGDFEDFEISEPMTTITYSESASSIHGYVPTMSSSTGNVRGTPPSTQEPALPPTNIPPPVLLLSIFPSAFASAQENLFGPLSKLGSAQRQQLLSHPATHQFLRNYLSQAVVLAHIIAGRKLRWKRDQILAQSMRIGPAAAGSKGGMKLTGIDKSEVVKEDREVLDAVRLWKAQIGKLRGAVTGASSAAKLPPVPEVSEQMPVKVLKAAEGGFVAPHACALCGLKREERVAKVDIDVNDSFGEWWVNGMDMHLTCKSWWDENRKKLQSR